MRRLNRWDRRTIGVMAAILYSGEQRHYTGVAPRPRIEDMETRADELFERVQYIFEMPEAPLVGEEIHGVTDELGAAELFHDRVDGGLQGRPRNDRVSDDLAKLGTGLPRLGQSTHVSQDGVELALLASEV